MNLHPHIEAKTYFWTDDCSSYNKLIAVLESDSKVVSTHKDCDNVKHLNNVNSFHSQIEKRYKKMCGVVSKFINRYAALFNIRFKVGSTGGSSAGEVKAERNQG